VAECLCDRDPDAALKLLDPLEDQSERDRHLANLARHTARTDPDRALDLIGRISADYARDGALATTLAFFPPDQLDRAVGLARGLEDSYQRCRALTLLASIAPQDRKAALLEEAAAGLSSAGDDPRGLGTRSGECAARLACVARRLGYADYPSLALVAMAANARTSLRYGGGYGYQRDDMDCARLLAFCAPDLAREMIESALARRPNLAKLHSYEASGLVSAACHVDPLWGVELIRQSAPDDPKDEFSRRMSAAITVARNLLESPDDLEYEVLCSDYQWSWIPTDEDW
jgi:hypothetical protein